MEKIVDLVTEILEYDAEKKAWKITRIITLWRINGLDAEPLPQPRKIVEWL